MFEGLSSMCGDGRKEAYWKWSFVFPWEIPSIVFDDDIVNVVGVLRQNKENKVWKWKWKCNFLLPFFSLKFEIAFFMTFYWLFFSSFGLLLFSSLLTTQSTMPACDGVCENSDNQSFQFSVLSLSLNRLPSLNEFEFAIFNFHYWICENFFPSCLSLESSWANWKWKNVEYSAADDDLTFAHLQV